MEVAQWLSQLLRQVLCNINMWSDLAEQQINVQVGIVTSVKCKLRNHIASKLLRMLCVRTRG